MTIEDIYRNELDLVREDTKLLENYRFDKEAVNSRHFDRLKLNIAIYNDLKLTDYEIVKFLFTEEMEWRKHAKDGEVDNLYFCAFLLTHFGAPEVIWLFFETKNIDFDSGIGFDGEYLLASGIKETYHYLKTDNNPLKAELLKYIGETEGSCIYSQEDIEDWKESTKSYFSCYKFPVQDELFFLYSTNERELFLTKLPAWIKQERSWTYEELALYRTYTKYIEDKALEIEALQLTIEKIDKSFSSDSYNIQLADLYIETGEGDKAFKILQRVVEGTDDNNIIRDCIEQLSRLIINSNSILTETAKESYNIIKAQQKKYKSFSPKVDSLIKEVAEIMKEDKITRPNSTLSKAVCSWLNKLLGSDKH